MKLGVTGPGELLLVGAPPGWSPVDLPHGVRVVRRARPPKGNGASVTIAFFSSPGPLARDIGQLATLIFPERALWVAWPRRASGHESALTDNVIRQLALAVGLVDTKVAAIDEDWSGLRFVWRRERRDGPVTGDAHTAAERSEPTVGG